MKARDAATRGGFVAAACVACCAPPIIAALGVTAGVAAAMGIFVGLAAAIAAVLVGATWITARRWRPRGNRGVAGSVPVGPPTRRADR